MAYTDWQEPSSPSVVVLPTPIWSCQGLDLRFWVCNAGAIVESDNHIPASAIVASAHLHPGPGLPTSLPHTTPTVSPPPCLSLPWNSAMPLGSSSPSLVPGGSPNGAEAQCWHLLPPPGHQKVFHCTFTDSCCQGCTTETSTVALENWAVGEFLTFPPSADLLKSEPKH